MTGVKSPGRRGAAKACAPKPVAKTRWTYKGSVPQAIEEDRAFYLLFCESKELELKINAKGDPKDIARFINVKEAMRRRWLEVMEPKPENPARRLLRLLENPPKHEEPNA